MRIIIYALTLGATISSAIAHNSSLCLYNATQQSIHVNWGGSTVEIASLSSYCKDNISTDKKETLNILSPYKGIIEVDQSQSNHKKRLTSLVLPESNGVLMYDQESGNYTNSYTIYQTAKPLILSMSNWMSKLSNTLMLNQIVIPGAHDAGMSETRNCTFFVKPSWTKAQRLNIYDQAAAGVRYFDIRVDYDHGKLTTFHRDSMGDGCSGESLKDVLDQAIQFLHDYPSEFLILKFSHTRSNEGHNAADIDTKVVNLLKAKPYDNYLYKPVVSENLAYTDISKLRGKLVAVFKHTDDKHNRGFDDKGYAKYINFALGILPYQDSESNIQGIDISDNYADKADYDEMLADQIKKWKQFASLGLPYQFLLSFTLTGEAGKADIEQLANTADAHLPGVLYQMIENESYNKPNIIYYDFVDAKLSQSIVQYNFL
ncbi:PI-PLC domain-containing protein [Facilibium subflavum]|uniref:hypothetical protein n=1 Tax=Facilibium subflavum TaxID=2219058 RepID=UPI0013C35A47|nr:hypothetical protein [Facilibium subflavum]